MGRKTAALAIIAISFFGLQTLAAADTQTAKDITEQFKAAGLAIDKLQVYEIGGVVLIRGYAKDSLAAAAAGAYAQTLGYKRVANLVTTFEPPDDLVIERLAERELTVHRSLDGCRFHVDSRQGVLHINGSVQYELQKDVAIQLLRNIDGVREVRSTLVRF
ncbi:MAG TPA: BON domain-containing protein [Thermoanaerobaculia bacterium]|nr:BON domain-containing protein [Thermoanaerobaculia bacterium]